MKDLVRMQRSLGRLSTLIARKDGSIEAVNKARLYEAPFFLCTNPPNNNVAMTAGQSAPSIAMRAAAEGPMQITELGAVRDSTHKPCKLQIMLQDGQGARPLMNAFCHIDTIFGPGGEMYPLPEALYLDENRALTVTFIDMSAIPVASKARDGANVATIVTSTPHGFTPGDAITVALVPADPTFDGNMVVIATPTTTSFTYASVGVLVATVAAGGTVSIIPTGNQARIVASAAKYSKVQYDPTLARIKERLQSTQYAANPYWYTADDGQIELTPMQYLEREITIDAQYDFEIHQLGVSSAGRFDVDIIDLTKGQSIINAPSNNHYLIPDRLLFGDNSYPYRFEEPPTIFAGQRLLVKLQDTSGYKNAINFALGGVQIKVANW